MRLQRLYNPVITAILRSPLHGLTSNSVMLLTYRGRRSGNVFTTPVSYACCGRCQPTAASTGACGLTRVVGPKTRPLIARISRDNTAVGVGDLSEAEPW